MGASIRHALLSIVVGTLGCGTAAGVCSCHPYDCAEWSTCADEAPAPGPTCIADPAIGRAEDDCGIFVSSSLGSDDNPGTRDLPVRTFDKAIALAQEGPMRVFACAEIFPEAIAVPSGVEIWGGLDCNDDWVYVGAERRTVLSPEPDRIPLRIAEGSGTSTIADVRAEAADATLPAGASIAVMVMAGAAAEILRSELVAGDGMAGRPGEDAPATPATAGTPGNNGGAACSAATVPGGAAAVTQCDDLESVGGEGGFGDFGNGGPGADGQPAPNPNPSEYGLGGFGDNGGGGCFNGNVGAPGRDGAQGQGAKGPGKLGLLGWSGEPGEDGGHGLLAQGGGGGGGVQGGLNFCGFQPTPPKGGASGGSGGGGGCGGKGGKGGEAGGASIGLIALSGDIAVRDTTILTGSGGDGGTGGLAQFGGAGGVGGAGGASTNGSPAGCPGSSGGKGGNGGYGGGGHGGPSIGIAFRLGDSVLQEGVKIETGTPGKGALGGNPAFPEGTGADGVKGDTIAFPQ